VPLIARPSRAGRRPNGVGGDGSRGRARFSRPRVDTQILNPRRGRLGSLRSGLAISAPSSVREIIQLIDDLLGHMSRLEHAFRAETGLAKVDAK
jgi:hypothetical protein